MSPRLFLGSAEKGRSNTQQLYRRQKRVSLKITAAVQKLKRVPGRRGGWVGSRVSFYVSLVFYVEYDTLKSLHSQTVRPAATRDKLGDRTPGG